MSSAAQSQEANVLVMLDQVNEKTRAARLPGMYSHILGRAAEYPEMRRIIEPPMQVWPMCVLHRLRAKTRPPGDRNIQLYAPLTAQPVSHASARARRRVPELVET